MTARRALLTGATGFVGRHLARRLLADGVLVSALVREHGERSPPAGVTEVPIPASTADLARAVESAAPDVCIHLATCFIVDHQPDDLEPMLEANVVFGARVAEALASVGRPVPLVDTTTVWQHVGGSSYNPSNLYAATKQAFADLLTAYAQHHGLPVARLTLTDTYGPGDDRAKLLPALLDAVRSGRTLEMGSGTHRVDLVHVDDVVDAFVRLADEMTMPAADRSFQLAPDGTTRFVASSGAPLSVRELVDRFEAAIGRPVPVAWGARPDRRVDGSEPTSPDPWLPGWSPRVELEVGLRGLLAG